MGGMKVGGGEGENCSVKSCITRRNGERPKTKFAPKFSRGSRKIVSIKLVPIFGDAH